MPRPANRNRAAPTAAESWRGGLAHESGAWRRAATRLVLLLACSGVLYPGEPPADEHHVKALFLYNFAKFVEWPSETPGDAICIAVIGDDSFGDVLDETVAGKKVNGRGFIVRRVKPEEQAPQCQIVFVAATEKKHLRSILDRLKGTATLTVGETRGFAQAGGVINFGIVDDKVRFEVNLEAAERARLKLSSKLLSLAKIVRETKD